MKAKLGRAAQHTQCLKVTEKVAFNIASEASYVYILSRQKFMKNAPKWSILASFWKPEACGQTVLPDRSILIGQKLVENTIVEEVKWNILSNFQTMWIRLGDDDDTHLLLKWNAKMNVVCILWELRDEFLQHSCHPIFMMCCSVGFF